MLRPFVQRAQVLVVHTLVPNGFVCTIHISSGYIPPELHNVGPWVVLLYSWGLGYLEGHGNLGLLYGLQGLLTDLLRPHDPPSTTWVFGNLGD